MKNKIKLGLTVTFLCLALLGVTACDSLAGGEEISQQLVKVEKGDLSVSVTGSGKIEASREARLTFGSGGKVDKILVKEGDVVGQGDVLAELDTSTLELAYAQSQMAVTQSEVALAQAQLSQTTAEYNLKNTQDMEDVLELALLNAQIGLATAEYALETTQDLYTWSDIKIAQADVDEAEKYLEYTIRTLSQYAPGTPGYEAWQDVVVHAQSRYNTAKARLEAMLSNRDVQEVVIKKQQVEAAEMAVAQAQKDLDEMGEDIAIQELQVTLAVQSVVQAEQSVELARQSLGDTQRQLDEANIIAPFGGVVAQVLAKEGDIVPSPSMAPKTIIHLVDPDLMELVVEVDEIDIPLLGSDQEAVITVDALQGVEFKGMVTAIYPVPKEVGGVVLYDVRLSLDAPGNSGVKIGMSASADILLEERSDVLVVPSRAVGTNDQGQAVVKVMVDEIIQEKVVTIGLDDGFRAEIVSGLSEGETVVVEVKVKSTSMAMF